MAYAKNDAELYDVDVRAVNYHILKIFEDKELQEDSVIRNFRITAADGKSYNTQHYNLQMIIAVGFKVNNERAVCFRKWAVHRHTAPELIVARADSEKEHMGPIYFCTNQGISADFPLICVLLNKSVMEKMQRP